MDIYTPYTYLIGWSKLNKWYYGVRYAQGCHPKDLWKTYFTSSKYVKGQRETYGEPDIVEVRKTFTTEKLARDWESIVLKRLNVVNEEHWLNKTNNRAIAGMPGKANPMYGNGHFISKEGLKRSINGGKAWRERVKSTGKWDEIYSKCSRINKNIIEIDGIVYESMGDACKSLNVSMYYIRKWLEQGKANMVKKRKGGASNTLY
jgi:hypothetical protein